MKKFIFTLFLPLFMMAHTLVFNAYDNEDGTMEVEGMFSTGQSTEGANFKLVSIASAEIEPKGGFQESKVKNINFAFYVTLILSVFFVIVALIVQFIRIKK